MPKTKKALTEARLDTASRAEATLKVTISLISEEKNSDYAEKLVLQNLVNDLLVFYERCTKF